MLNDAAVSQFKKVYLAPPDILISAGGSMDWFLLSAFVLNLTLMIKIHFFCSAEEKTAGSRPFCRKAMVSFSCTKGWITVLSGGQGRQMKQWPSQMTSTRC